MMHLARWAGLGAMAAFVMACGPGGTTETTTLAETRGGPGCPIVYCGDNAPTVGDNFIFDQLHVGAPSEPNHAGVRIVGTTIELDGKSFDVKLGVDRHWFYVELRDGSKLHGMELVNKRAVVTLENVRVKTQPKMQFLFAGFSEEPVRFQAGEHEAVPVYLLMARLETDPPKQGFTRRVCNEKTPLGPDPHWNGAHSNHALVFRGDQYDPTERRVLEERPQDEWSFLGCAGSAGAKMHLFRHTYAGSFKYSDPHTPGPVADPRQLEGVPRPFNTSLKQRTALLKAITADYCGTGTTFTVQGQKLAFTTAAEFMPALPAQGQLALQRPLRSLEAVWDHDGAICIEEPRREKPSEPGRVLGQKLPRAKVDWTPAAINERCGRQIPACKIPPEKWKVFRLSDRIPTAVTANP